jgi:nicotinate-nucleotide pyrophosphorylase
MMGSETAEISQMQASRPIPEAIQIEIDKLKELTEIGRMQARLMWNYTIE